jgi:hypothetical protein
MALSFIANPVEKDKAVLNKIRDNDGLAVIGEFLNGEREEVRHLSANLVRSIYLHWPIAE